MATTLESRETTSLIGSDKVDGTSVYGIDGKKIGAIERVMIDKVSMMKDGQGRVCRAQLRRLPRDGRGFLSTALVNAEL